MPAVTRNAELFRRMADIIEGGGVPGLQYYQGTWMDHDDIPTGVSPERPASTHLCGTRACLAGHAAILTNRVEINWEFVSYDEDEVWVDDDDSEDGGYWEAAMGSNGWWEAHYLLNGSDDYSWGEEGRKALGLYYAESCVLFGGSWEPASGMTVPEVLRALADGAHICSVTAHAGAEMKVMMDRQIKIEAADPKPVMTSV